MPHGSGLIPIFAQQFQKKTAGSVNSGRFSQIKLFRVDRYNQIYRRQTLDAKKKFSVGVNAVSAHRLCLPIKPHLSV